MSLTQPTRLQTLRASYGFIGSLARHYGLRIAPHPDVLNLEEGDPEDLQFIEGLCDRILLAIAEKAFSRSTKDTQCSFIYGLAEANEDWCNLLEIVEQNL